METYFPWLSHKKQLRPMQALHSLVDLTVEERKRVRAAANVSYAQAMQTITEIVNAKKGGDPISTGC